METMSGAHLSIRLWAKDSKAHRNFNEIANTLLDSNWRALLRLYLNVFYFYTSIPSYQVGFTLCFK